MSDPAVMHGVLRHFRRTERRRRYDQLPDADLLARFLADRDEPAFEELVTRHGPMVRAVCRRVLGPSADADDAFQAAFLVLLRKARSVRRTDLLANWLCAVAYRTARQALRRRSRIGARERPVEGLPEPSRPDDPPKDWLPLFDAALQRLPARYREPVILCELQGLSRAEAARRLGLNEGTLSSRLGRARDRLRQQLGRHGFPLAVGAALAPTAVPEALTASVSAAAVCTGAASVSAVVLTEGVLTAMFASKLKAGAVCAAVVLIGVAAGLQFSHPVSRAGGPPDAGEPAPKEPKVTFAPATPAPDPKPARLAAEYEPFQGEWEVVAAEQDGVPAGAAGVAVDDRWKFTGNVLSTGGEAKADGGIEFSLDPRAKPPAINFSLTRFSPDGTGVLLEAAYQGIYQFESEDRLVICYRAKDRGALRPTRFATSHNSGATVLTLQRHVLRPPPAPLEPDYPHGGTAARNDMPVPNPAPTKSAEPAAGSGHVVGAWELTDVDGLTPDAACHRLDKEAGIGTLRPDGSVAVRAPRRWEVMRRLRLLSAGGPMDLANQPNAPSYLAYADLDPDQSPKWITLHASEQGPYQFGVKTVRLCGIYKFDGDRLVVCLPDGQVSPLLRPKEFKGDGEGGLYVLTYQRPAKEWKPGEPVPPVGDPLAPAGGPAPWRADQTEPMYGGHPPAGRTPVLPPRPAPQLVEPVNSLPPPTAPAPLVPSMPGDLGRLQGVWTMTRSDGKPPQGGDDNPNTLTIEFLKDRVLLANGTHGRVKLNETRVPPQMTIEMPEPKSAQTAIYRLDGDTLTIAYHSNTSKLVPAAFESDTEVGISVDVYERQKGPRPETKPAAGPSAAAGPRVGTAIGAAVGNARERDLAKEVEELREQLKRLEKVLKDRKPQN